MCTYDVPALLTLEGHRKGQTPTDPFKYRTEVRTQVPQGRERMNLHLLMQTGVASDQVAWKPRPSSFSSHCQDTQTALLGCISSLPSPLYRFF